MTIKQQLDIDLKTALLSGDKATATTLRGLKAVILNEEVAKGVRDSGLDDDVVTALLQKEAKKRQESADLYKQGGNIEKHDAELAEKAAIEKYLPAQLTEAEITIFVDEAIQSIGNDPQKMGQIIGAAKQKAGAAADGAIIARIVKERLAA